MLEGETQETTDAQLSFLHERALPDLASDIECGNSLVGPDFYVGQQTPCDIVAQTLDYGSWASAGEEPS